MSPRRESGVAEHRLGCGLCGVSRRVVGDACEFVLANPGVVGVDAGSVAEFEADLTDNLCRLWVRFSSGVLMPPPVVVDSGLGVGGVALVGDSVAQVVVRLCLVPGVMPHLPLSSFGYRSRRSVLDMVAYRGRGCGGGEWVADFDSRSFFGSFDDRFVLRAVAAYTRSSWILCYVNRWLKAPVWCEDGTVLVRDGMVPRGSVLSPVLSSLLRHYAFALWMGLEFPTVAFEHHEDRIVLYCRSDRQAMLVLGQIAMRTVWSNVQACKGTRFMRGKHSDRWASHDRVRHGLLRHGFRSGRTRDLEISSSVDSWHISETVEGSSMDGMVV